jgi:hypothetical protein
VRTATHSEKDMSRSGYIDDCEPWALIRWRGAVKSAIKGARGQKFLRELLDAMDAMPDKKLIPYFLEADGSYCTLGVIAKSRGINTDIDPDDTEILADRLGIADAMIREIVFENDEGGSYWKTETPEQRWQRMRAWVAGHISEPAPHNPT